MVRTIETAQYFTSHKREWRCLEEINAGICDGLTYEEIEVRNWHGVKTLDVFRDTYYSNIFRDICIYRCLLRSNITQRLIHLV